MKILTELTYSHFEQMARLEQEFYDDDHITPPDEAFLWYKKHPYTVIVAEESGEIAGFINLFPVSDAVFEKLKAGTFNDKDLTAGDIADIYASQDTLHMFLSCIVVRPEYRKHGLTHQLLQKAVEQYDDVAHRCDVVVTDNVTPEGIAFSRKYGFAPLGSSQHASLLQIQKYSDFCKNINEKGIR